MLIRMIGSVCVLLALAWAPPARSETFHTCTGFISSLPAIITTQGVWCMNQDLSTAITTGNAITVATNNVTLDCNHYKLGGLAAGAATAAYGLFATGRLNTTVRNCNIRGFQFGMYVAGAGGGHVVEDNRFEANTFTGARVEGDGSIVRRNQVVDTGAGTLYPDAYGLYLYFSVDAVDNTVSGVIARPGFNGGVTGIYTAVSASGRISGNSVSGLIRDGNGVAIAINNDSDTRVTIRDNDLVGDGSTFTKGIDCESNKSLAKDNVINGFLLPVIVCATDGNVSVF